METTRNHGVWVAGLVAVLGGLPACSAGLVEPRIVASAGQTVVYVEGQGEVHSSALRIHCGPGLDARECVSGAQPLAPPTLTAKPASGWAFDHWEMHHLNPSCSPPMLWEGLDRSAGKTVAYTAVFVPKGSSQTAMR